MSTSTTIAAQLHNTSSITTGVLIPAGNILRLPVMPTQNSIILINKIGNVSAAIKNKKIESKPVKGKVKIPALRQKITPKPKRVRRKKVEVERERQDKNVPAQTVDTAEEKSLDKNTKTNDIGLESNEGKDTAAVINVNESVIKQVSDPMIHKSDTVKPQVEPEQSLPEPELSNEILQSLDVSPSESENHHHPDHHHESLSPTAAFLLSFPVVSLAASRLTDVDPTDSNQLTDMPLPSKTSTQLNAGHSMLDNISSLFACKEFDGSQPMSFDTDVGTCKKYQTKISMMPDLNFDFQLKPLNNSKTYSTNCLNSTIVTSEVKSSTSKMSNMFFEPIAPKSCNNFHGDPVFGRPTTGINNVPQNDTTFSFSLSTTIDTKPIISSTNMASDRVYGFYDSLSAIGSSYKSNYSVMEPKLEFIPPPPPPPPPVKNFNKSASLYPVRLPIVPSTNTNAIENLEYLPQTPFTFSLTTSVVAQPTITYDSSTKTKISNSMDSFLSTTPAISPMHTKYNPFAFDNIHSTSTATGSCSMPYMTSSDTSSGFSFALTSVTDKTTTVRNSISQSTSFSSFPINYNMLPEPPVKFKQPPSFTGIMPPPFNNNAVDVHLPPRTLSASHLDFNISTSSTAYPSLTNLDSKKVEPYFAHPSISVVSADEHFPWSPNKMLDSSALPTLHGDLALNTISSSGGLLHCDRKHHKRTKLSAKLNGGSDFAYAAGGSGGHHHSSALQGCGNFLSVSNLVSETKRSDPHHHRQKSSKSKGAHDNHGTLPACSAEGYPFGGGYNNNEQSASSVSRLHNNYSTESLISQNSKKYGGSVGISNSTDYYNTESSGTNYLYPNVSNTDYGNDSNYNYYNSNYHVGNGVSADTDYNNMSSMYLSDQFSSAHNSKSNVSQRSSNRITNYNSGAQKKLFGQDHMYPPPPPPPHIGGSTSIHDLSSHTGSHNSNSYHFVAPPPPPPLPMANDDYLLPNATPGPIMNASISGNYKNLYFHGASVSDNFSTGVSGAVSVATSIGTSSLVTNFNLSTILS